MSHPLDKIWKQESVFALISATQIRIQELKAEKTPMPHGRYMKYSSWIPARTPDELRATESDPLWHAYADKINELKSILCATAVQNQIGRPLK